MKILTTDKVREADSFTMKNEPITSIDLMERAAGACVKWLVDFINPDSPLAVIAGPGNNGGDGLVIARLLSQKGYNVEVFVIRFSEKGSGDFETNLNRINKETKVDISDIRDGDDFPEFNKNVVIVDAVFGSGLSRPVEGFVASFFNHINKGDNVVVAIDIPSGLFADSYTDSSETAIIEASHTLSLEMPKYALFFSSNYKYVGEWHTIQIGLHQEYINKAETQNFLFGFHEAIATYKLRSKFSHKGTYGHALLLAGSIGKCGAAILAAKGALSAGAGLITAHLPQCGVEIMQVALPECMVSTDERSEIITSLPDLSRYNVIGIGPGIGNDEQTAKLVKLLIQQSQLPLLFDADAINILAENPTWLSFVPPASILTPHPKEFDRLTGKSEHDFERIEKARDFAYKYSLYIVLKGAHTAVIGPDKSCWFNATGNPGLAKGGSGDTLTGIILGLLAQGYQPGEAASLGVFIHGLAADLLAEEMGQDAMLSSQVTENMGVAWKILEKEKGEK